jgi:DNA-binding MarR family transcriptional regulator
VRKSSSGGHRAREMQAQPARTRRNSVSSESVALSEGAAQPIPAVDLGVMRDSVSFQLRYASWAVHAAFGASFSSGDAVPRQYSVLYLVSRNAGINVKALAEAIGVDQSTLVPTLNVCEDRGWIRRHRGKPDRRVTVLELTKAGKAHLRASGEMLDAHEAAMTAGLSPAQHRQLLVLLRKIRSNAMAARAASGAPEKID